MSALSELLKSIWNLISSIWGDGENGPEENPIVFPTDITKMFGWGISHAWMEHESEWEQWAKSLKAAKCNITPIELFISGKDRLDTPAVVLTPLAKFIDIMNASGIIVHVIIINWNLGRQPGWGKCICGYSEAYLKTVIDQVIAVCKDKHVLLEPVTEWDDANKQCTSMANKLCDYAAKNWTGIRLWNRGSRPNSCPSGWVNNYHVNEPSTLGPKGNLVTTDTSKILNWLGGQENFMANTDRLRALVAAVKNHNCGFSGYTVSPPGIDEEAIKIIGEVFKT